MTSRSSSPRTTRTPTARGYQRLTPLVDFDPSVHRIERVGPVAPLPVLTGPLSFTASGALDRIPRFVWDVNGYYASLGVEVTASRRRLMEAYRDLDGPSSPRLTMVLKNLLDPRLRWLYDISAPGEVFLDDEVLAAARLRVLDEHMGEPADDTPDVPDPSEPSDPTDPDGLDDPDAPPEVQVDMEWGWGYLVWNCLPDEVALRSWQGILCRVYAGWRTRLCVGIASLPDASLGEAFVMDYADLKVCFIRAGAEPTEALARSLRSSLL